MRRARLASLLLCLAASCLAQTVCPRHIETPIRYPQLARAANVQGTVVLKVTIGADGNVTDAVVNDAAHPVQPVLQEAAIDNIRRWTFEKPAAGPVTQVMVYEFKFDSSLPVNPQNYSITTTKIDLPDRVTILTNEKIIESDRSRKKRKSGGP